MMSIRCAKLIAIRLDSGATADENDLTGQHRAGTRIRRADGQLSGWREY